MIYNTENWLEYAKGEYEKRGDAYIAELLHNTTELLSSKSNARAQMGLTQACIECNNLFIDWYENRNREISSGS